MSEHKRDVVEDSCHTTKMACLLYTKLRPPSILAIRLIHDQPIALLEVAQYPRHLHLQHRVPVPKKLVPDSFFRVLFRQQLRGGYFRQRASQVRTEV